VKVSLNIRRVLPPANAR